MATSLPPSNSELDGLETLCKRATPGPWASTTGCGATVHVGYVCIDRPGHTAIAKGGFNLFEIDPDVYARSAPGEDESDDAEAEERCSDQAEADARYIAALNPTTALRLIHQIRDLRGPRTWPVNTKEQPLLSNEALLALCRAATGGARELEFSGVIRIEGQDLPLCGGSEHDVNWITPADAEFTTKMSPYQVHCLVHEVMTATRHAYAYAAMLREHGLDPNQALGLKPAAQ